MLMIALRSQVQGIGSESGFGPRQGRSIYSLYKTLLTVDAFRQSPKVHGTAARIDPLRAAAALDVEGSRVAVGVEDAAALAFESDDIVQHVLRKW